MVAPRSLTWITCHGRELAVAAGSVACPRGGSVTLPRCLACRLLEATAADRDRRLLCSTDPENPTMNATITTHPARPASRRSLFGAVVRVDPAVEAALVGNLLDQDPRDRGELLTTCVIVSPPISEKSKRELAGVF